MTRTIEDLSPADGRALLRFARRMAGSGFKLAIVEVPTPAVRMAVSAWLTQELSGIDIDVDWVDLSDLRGANLWAELSAHVQNRGSTPQVVGLFGLEGDAGEVEERGGRNLVAQLNVQRDVLVRDLPYPWILFVHPYTSRALQDRAPDFADFAVLWIESSSLHTSSLAAAPRQVAVTAGGKAVNVEEWGNEVLSDIYEHVLAGRTIAARDQLSTFLASQSADAPPAELALVRGVLRHALGEPIAASVILQSALDSVEEPDPTTILLLTNLSKIQSERGQYSASQQSFQRAVRMADQLLPDATALRSMLQAATADRLVRTGKLVEARRHARQAVALASELGPGEGDSAMCDALVGLGAVYAAEYRINEALEASKLSLKLARRLSTPDSSERLANVLFNVGLLLVMSDRLSEAVDPLEESLKLHRERYGDLDHPQTMLVEQQMAEVLLRMGRTGEGEARLRDLLRRDQALWGDEGSGLTDSLYAGLAHAAASRGDMRESMRLIKQSLAREQALRGTDRHPSIGVGLANLGRAHLAVGNAAAAVKALERALSILRDTLQYRGTVEEANTIRDLSIAYDHSGQSATREEFLYENYRTLRRDLGSTHPTVALLRSLRAR